MSIRKNWERGAGGAGSGRYASGKGVIECVARFDELINVYVGILIV
jgi:hypothetical protein